MQTRVRFGESRLGDGAGSAAYVVSSAYLRVEVFGDHAPGARVPLDLASTPEPPASSGVAFVSGGAAVEARAAPAVFRAPPRSARRRRGARRRAHRHELPGHRRVSEVQVRERGGDCFIPADANRVECVSARAPETASNARAASAPVAVTVNGRDFSADTVGSGAPGVSLFDRTSHVGGGDVASSSLSARARRLGREASFFYGAKLEVFGLDPTRGPASGGTEVTARGAHFLGPFGGLQLAGAAAGLVPDDSINAAGIANRKEEPFVFFGCKLDQTTVPASAGSVTASSACCRSPPHAAGFVAGRCARRRQLHRLRRDVRVPGASDRGHAVPARGRRGGGTLVSVAGANFVDSGFGSSASAGGERRVGAKPRARARASPLRCGAAGGAESAASRRFERGAGRCDEAGSRRARGPRASRGRRRRTAAGRESRRRRRRSTRRRGGARAARGTDRRRHGGARVRPRVHGGRAGVVPVRDHGSHPRGVRQRGRRALQEPGEGHGEQDTGGGVQGEHARPHDGRRALLGVSIAMMRKRRKRRSRVSTNALPSAERCLSASIFFKKNATSHPSLDATRLAWSSRSKKMSTVSSPSLPSCPPPPPSASSAWHADIRSFTASTAASALRPPPPAPPPARSRRSPRAPPRRARTAPPPSPGSSPPRAPPRARRPGPPPARARASRQRRARPPPRAERVLRVRVRRVRGGSSARRAAMRSVGGAGQVGVRGGDERRRAAAHPARRRRSSWRARAERLRGGHRLADAAGGHGGSAAAPAPGRRRGAPTSPRRAHSPPPPSRREATARGAGRAPRRAARSTAART